VNLDLLERLILAERDRRRGEAIRQRNQWLAESRRKNKNSAVQKEGRS
jgi:hypothetical protein